MKKIFWLIILISSYLNADNSIPDFQRIVGYQHQIRQQEIDFYRSLFEAADDLREMENFDVHYYRIAIELDFDNEFIESSNLIHLQIMENDVNTIQVHLADFLIVDEIIQNTQTLSYTHQDGIIEIILDSVYNSGDEISLEIFYSGYPNLRLEDGIKFEEHSGVPVVFSMVSPRGARKWWPCKDTPADKPDSLDIWITYPSEYVCASNGNLQEEIYHANGTKTSKWHESYPVATYLTSFAITNYQMYSFVWEYQGQQMMVDNFIYPEQATASTILYASCFDMLTFLSDTYGIFPFINEKYGHATCTNLGAVAMEHQTCTSFDAGYITNPAAEYTVMHELGHSWAGNSLSIGSWSNVWLKEGFASYSEALWAENLYGEQGLQDYMQAEDTGSALNECLYRDESLGANHIFNSVVYNKGSWTVHMLRWVLGDDDFFDLLPYYFQHPDFIYGNVFTEDLKNCAETIAGYDLDWFFDQWFYNYGRPYYNFATYSSATVDSIIIAIESIGSMGDPFSMFVPLRLNDADHRLWTEAGLNHCTIFSDEEIYSLQWDADNWVLDGGFTEQIPVLDEVSQNRDGSAVLTWSDFFDPAIEGFDIFRKQASEEYQKINILPVTTPFYYDEDVIGGEVYFYKIAAVFQGDFISKYSNEIELVPVEFTFDEGILLVDGTRDFAAGSPFPSDEDVDLFYGEILEGYAFTNWDVAAQGKPPLNELAKYSSVIWHTDDLMNYPFQNDLYNIKSYLLAGGNLLLSAWKMLYALGANFNCYYLNFANPVTNDNPDFIGAVGQNGFPDIAIDPAKIPLPIWNNALQSVVKFDPINSAQAIYLYDSQIDDPDWENMVCAQKFSGDFKLYVFGFPLYYMEQSAAAEIVELVLQDFGEATSAFEPEIPPQSTEISNLTIFPNPFNPSTTITFSVAQSPSTVEIEIYNLKGQKVKTLLNSPSQSHTISIVWDGTDQYSKPASSGIYFARLKSGTAKARCKMLLIK